jgi:putative transposase
LAHHAPLSQAGIPAKILTGQGRYLQWHYQARKRYGLRLLNFIVTSNHVHLLVVDGGDRDVIPHSMQLVASRTGQEFNQRKNRIAHYRKDRCPAK